LGRQLWNLEPSWCERCRKYAAGKLSPFVEVNPLSGREKCSRLAEHPYQHSRRSLQRPIWEKFAPLRQEIEAVAGWEKVQANATVGKITEHFRKDCIDAVKRLANKY